MIGEQLYKPHRSTVRPPYIQFQSPPKTLPRDGAKKKQLIKQEETPKLVHSKQNDFKSPKYYFQPTNPVFPEASNSTQYPARGELVPVAKSLGKPRQDERLRLPIPSGSSASATFGLRRKCTDRISIVLQRFLLVTVEEFILLTISF